MFARESFPARHWCTWKQVEIPTECPGGAEAVPQMGVVLSRVSRIRSVLLQKSPFCCQLYHSTCSEARAWSRRWPPIWPLTIFSFPPVLDGVYGARQLFRIGAKSFQIRQRKEFEGIGFGTAQGGEDAPDSDQTRNVVPFSKAQIPGGLSCRWERIAGKIIRVRNAVFRRGPWLARSSVVRSELVHCHQE